MVEFVGYASIELGAPGLTLLPERIVDETEPLVSDAHQVRVGPDHADLCAPSTVGLLPPIPDDLPPI